jgi:sigma-B regulation protein RsbQ
MAANSPQNFNDFCSGHMVVNAQRKIIFCNTYINHLSDQPENILLNSPISSCFTKASNIFIDSYLYPLLLVEKVAQEMQLSWINKQQQVIPVVVNIRLSEEGESFWSLYECTNRDKLHDELIKAKERLEEQSKELFQLATTDPLTGLINRRALQNQANIIINQELRNQSTFALLSIDVDFFKQVNDNYGHLAGDNVLKHLAKVLSKGRRVNDVVARVGGEEFVLLLPDIDDVNAYTLAETIRKNIENEVIANINITVSIGLVVSHKNESVDFDTLFKLSDDALYHSKQTGRNKTTMATY